MPDTWSPALEQGEEVRYHHVPSVPAFWRAMLRPVGILFLILTAPFILFRGIFPADTPWLLIGLVQFVVWVPIIAGVAIERTGLKNYETYITDRRAISRGYGALPLSDSHGVEPIRTGVRLTEADGVNFPLEMRYPEDPEALTRAVQQVLGAPQAA